MKKLVGVVLAVVFVMSACGPNLKANIANQGNVAAMQEGTLTKADVLAKFGKPDATGISTEGETWSYNVTTHRKLGFGKEFGLACLGLSPIQEHCLILTFNKDGTLVHKSLQQQNALYSNRYGIRSYPKLGDVMKLT
jgi:outer membrane protein assembly factor BamE (lipoprotein component of BamABCDE complex)